MLGGAKVGRQTVSREEALIAHTRANAYFAFREADLGSFADLSDSERIVGNLHRAYAELEGAAPGAPIDLMAAFRDTIDFNGGRPLRCLA